VYHDSVIQDFTVLSPNSKILGEVNLGSKTLVGASAMILPRVEVGNHVIIGANSLVTKSIKDHSVVYGQPARFIKKVECESC
jgi:acetyltransferase-like isoleucine patch superfamily enzyme